MAKMTVYHGGYTPVKHPEIREGRNTKDFGTGFYCTVIKEQAQRWAKRYDDKIVSIYEVRLNTHLNIKEFKDMTDEWLDFIIDCRSGKPHQYDIVIGAMENDQIYNYVSDYIDGAITREQFWVLAKFKYPTHQINFCTREALKCLEYRGYDSAGIAVIENQELVVMKDKGRVANLKEIPGIEDLTSSIGIAHTRWATHGKPSKENSHPHMDNANLFAVVHNGIIENYRELKEILILQGYQFHSETDSEVVVHMMDYYYKKEKDLQKALERVITRIEGSYALCIVSTIEPDKVFIAKKDSPLVIGKTADASVAASDIPAILDYTKDVYFLEDYEIAILNKGNVSFFDQYGNPIEKEITTIPYDNEAAQKGGYDTFMLKEIHEQPYAIAETLRGRVEGTDRIVLPELDAIHDKFKTFNKAYFVACGTAYHACLSGANILERLTGIPTFTQVASEFRYCDPIVDEKTMCVFVSQSGETADTMAALRLAKEKGCTTIAVANVLGSSISREADHTIYTCAGPEIAVASTKAYTTQLIVLLLLGMYISQALGNENEDYKRIIEGIASLPQHIENILKDEKTFEHYASYLKDLKDAYYIGRSLDYATVLEGALKLKEVSYVHADAYIAGELKHGPIALIEQGSLVIAVATQPNIAAKTISNIQETIARGANVILFTIDGQEVGNVKETYILPDVDPILQSVLVAVPLQLIAYYAAGLKGCDVDKPRNLAKSVTVE